MKIDFKFLSVDSLSKFFFKITLMEILDFHVRILLLQ